MPSSTHTAPSSPAVPADRGCRRCRRRRSQQYSASAPLLAPAGGPRPEQQREVGRIGVAVTVNVTTSRLHLPLDSYCRHHGDRVTSMVPADRGCRRCRRRRSQQYSASAPLLAPAGGPRPEQQREVGRIGVAVTVNVTTSRLHLPLDSYCRHHGDRVTSMPPRCPSPREPSSLVLRFCTRAAPRERRPCREDMSSWIRSCAEIASELPWVRITGRVLGCPNLEVFPCADSPSISVNPSSSARW